MNWSVIVKQFRHKNSLTQEQLAAMLGIAKSTVIRWEKSVCKPRQSIYEKIIRLAKEQKDYDTVACTREMQMLSKYNHKEAQIILEIRVRAKLTQEEFAERIGVAGITVKRWERGRCKPSKAILKIVLEKFIDVSLCSGICVG